MPPMEQMAHLIGGNDADAGAITLNQLLSQGWRVVSTVGVGGGYSSFGFALVILERTDAAPGPSAR